MNSDQSDSTDRSDTEDIEKKIEDLESGKKPESRGVLNRIRTWYYNRGTYAPEDEVKDAEVHRKAKFFKRVGKPVQISPVKLRVVRARNSVRDFFQDHPKTNFCTEQVLLIVLEFVSAFIFAYGFRTFISPSRVPWSTAQASLELPPYNLSEVSYNSLPLTEAASLISPSHLVSGGASGIGQVLTRICLLFGLQSVPQQTLQSIFYFLVNVPIIVLGFLKVGKKFTFYSLINVIFTSLLIDAIPQDWCELINIYEDPLARALAGGLTTGLSSGLALRIGTSTGGVDILSIFIAEHKGTTVGKYSLAINAGTVIAYTVLSFIHAPVDALSAIDNGSTQLTMSLYTIIYFFTSTFFVDFLNTKNKKMELQVFTTSKVMNKVLVHGFPHACTLLEAKGGYSGTPLNVIYIVVSYSETKKAVRIMRQVDSRCFISVLSTKQVYGKFYIKPLE